MAGQRDKKGIKRLRQRLHNRHTLLEKAFIAKTPAHGIVIGYHKILRTVEIFKALLRIRLIPVPELSHVPVKGRGAIPIFPHDPRQPIEHIVLESGVGLTVHNRKKGVLARKLCVRCASLPYLLVIVVKI